MRRRKEPQPIADPHDIVVPDQHVGLAGPDLIQVPVRRDRARRHVPDLLASHLLLVDGVLGTVYLDAETQFTLLPDFPNGYCSLIRHHSLLTLDCNQDTRQPWLLTTRQP
jgi:hypothetical protein